MEMIILLNSILILNNCQYHPLMYAPLLYEKYNIFCVLCCENPNFTSSAACSLCQMKLGCLHELIDWVSTQGRHEKNCSASETQISSSKYFRKNTLFVTFPIVSLNSIFVKCPLKAIKYSNIFRSERYALFLVRICLIFPVILGTSNYQWL